MASKSFTDQAVLWSNIFVQILLLLKPAERNLIATELGKGRKPTKSKLSAMEKAVSDAVSRTPSSRAVGRLALTFGSDDH